MEFPIKISLLPWATFDKLYWGWICAICELEFIIQHPEKIDWKCISINPNMIPLIKMYPHKIEWDYLSANVNATDLLMKNMNTIHFKLVGRSYESRTKLPMI